MDRRKEGGWTGEWTEGHEARKVEKIRRQARRNRLTGRQTGKQEGRKGQEGRQEERKGGTDMNAGQARRQKDKKKREGTSPEP